MFSRYVAASLLVAFGVACVGAAFADGRGKHRWDDDDRGPGGRDGKTLQAQPWVFVGTAADCNPFPAGHDIVTSAWLGGMGLPDDGVTANPGPVGSRRNAHLGLLLNKNGPTSDCSASGATIKGFKRGGTISELGFDYRVGGHCGAGAPRFNITTTAGDTYFAGCADGTSVPAPQDPAEWMRVRFANAQIFPASGTSPAFLLGTTPVRSIDIVYDEGTDTPSTSDPTGVGLAVIDNIDINNTLITAGRGIAPKVDGKVRNGREDADDD
jgi:hypothetical protein